jgi:signal transduction histidine kinase
MKLRISLYTRFMIYICLLLIFLVGLILFVIGRREVNAIFEESKNKGLLIAKNIAYLNLTPLLFGDIEAIKKNIEDQINEELLYVIIYDRFNKPVVSSDLIRNYQEIYCCSRLEGKVTLESYSIESQNLKIAGRAVRILELEIPVFAKGSPQKWGSIKIGQSLENMHAEARKTRFILILIGCGGFLFGIVGATLLARRITRPLKKLADGTVKISKGDFSHKIEMGTQDEIGNLARSFNEMTQQLLQARERMEAANKRLVQAEKLASIGRISATIAHEIRNPLTSVKLNIQKVSQNEELDEIEHEHLNISQEGIGQIEKFINELLNFTRVSDLNLDRFSMEQILQESIKMLADSFRQKRIALEKNFGEGLPQVLVDGDKMRQVFLNILRNACEAVNEGGKISISLSLDHEDGRKKIKVKISDNGVGIPEKDWENIFEPFYTTKSSGFGLGLANSRKIVEQHNGSIRAVKKRGKGSSFVVLLPCEEGT